MAIDYTPPAFYIRELEGQARVLVLKGRALPYQGVAWEASQKVVTTYYPGNPVATQQIVGTEYGPTEIHGMWKARFLPGQVETAGFGDIDNPEALVLAMEAILEGGSPLEVVWGNIVRYGVLSNFKANWLRLQDVEWSAEFTWKGKEQTAPRASGLVDIQAPVTQALGQWNDSGTLYPTNLLNQWLGGFQALLFSARVASGEVLGSLRQASAAVQVPRNAALGAASAANAFRGDAQAILQQTVDVPYTSIQVDDSVVSVLDLESWRRSQALETRRLNAAQITQARNLVDVIEPGAIAIVSIAQNTTLRQLAIKYYGNADRWQAIADANGFVDSQVEAGTLVIIPPAGASQGASVSR